MTSAAALTYDSLVSDIQIYAERDDQPFVDQIPRFIMLTENKLAMEVKPLGFVRIVSGTMSGNTMVKPTRWRRTKSLSILVNNARQYLYERSYEYCRQYWPDASVTGVPEYYADYDFEHFFLAGTPTANYSFELSYWERPEPLSSVNQTNWTTQYAPQLLLYGALLEAQPFLKLGERMQEFQGLYDRALMALTKEDEGRQIDNAAQRNSA
jgi:hypothetical protein